MASLDLFRTTFKKIPQLGRQLFMVHWNIPAGQVPDDVFNELVDFF